MFKNNEVKKEYFKKWREDNRDYRKQWLEKHKDYHPIYNPVKSKKRSNVEIIIRDKLESFNRFYQVKQKTISNTKIEKLIKQKILNFCEDQMKFTIEQLLEKIGDEPKCYISGESINLLDSKSWSLDHIIPKSKGGDNSINNCGITTRQVNTMKSDIMYEDFIKICEKITEYNKKSPLTK